MNKREVLMAIMAKKRWEIYEEYMNSIDDPLEIWQRHVKMNKGKSKAEIIKSIMQEVLGYPENQEKILQAWEKAKRIAEIAEKTEKENL